MLALLSLLGLGATAASAQYTATYTVGSLPDKTEGNGQVGTNNCGTGTNPTSMCQNVFLNSVDDFCLWGPPAAPGSADWQKLSVGHIEQIAVSYCLKEGYGTRLMPSGTITSAHFVKVESSKVSYVQITGNGDLTKIGLMPNDDGGELDPHSWTGLGNPEGGLVFTNAFTGKFEQLHEWTSFPSSGAFCIRGCRDGGQARDYCEHIYDVLGCGFTIPGSYDPGFDNCLGAPTDEAPGIYNGQKFQQGDPNTPAAHPAGPTSQCTQVSTIGGGTANLAIATGSVSSSSSRNATASSTSASGSASSSGSMVTSRTGSASASITSGPSGSAASAANAASASATSSRPNGAAKIGAFGGSSIVAGVVGMVVGAVAILA